MYYNLLTDDLNDFSARVSSERSLSIGDICNSAGARGGADISAASMKHAVELFLKEMAYQLCDGFSVNTGYFTASPSIRGVFNSPTENFDSNKHSILFQFNQGEMLRNELPGIKVEILGTAESGAFIGQVLDVKSGSVNDLLTPNRNLRIGGSKLKVTGDSPEIGIYFVNQATQARVKVDESDIVTNNPSEVIIITPALTAGSYKIEISTQYSGSAKLLKEQRVLLFDKELTVA